VRRLLEKDPTRRPDSAAAVVAAFRRATRPHARRGAAARGAPRANDPLPAPPARLLGRRAEIGTLVGRRERVRVGTALRGSGRGMTLIGARGCGKTRLAIEVGRVMRGHDGARPEPDVPVAADAGADAARVETEVWFADLSSAADGAAVAAAIAAAAGLADP